MDFWDLTVLIFRRWKVALPLLLLSVGVAAFVAVTAKPDYTMTSYVQLIPVRVDPADNPTSAALRNPWNQLGLNTLGQASIYTTQDQQFLDTLKAGEHTDTFTLTMTYPNPIVTVEVVGTSRESARETTQLVIDRLRQSAVTLQKGSGVSDADLIATQRLDQGQNLQPSSSKVKRAILAVAAAGLVLTAGGTVAFDAYARRRSRRRDEPERPLSGVRPARLAAGPARPAARSAKGAPAGRTIIARQRTVRVLRRRPTAPTPRRSDVAVRPPANAASGAAADAAAPAAESGAAPVDAGTRITL